MQGKSIIGIVALALLTGGAVWAQDDEKTFEGSVELLWRNVNVDGNKDKYEADYEGLSSGGRIGNLWLNFVNDGEGPINYAQVQAQGVGGDPFEFASLRVGATGKWDVRYNRRKQLYFYNLFDYMDDEDGHEWETRREIDEIDLKLYPTKNIDVVVGYRQNNRGGNSLFMKDVSRELFQMFTPIDQVRRDFDVGLNWRIGSSVDIVFRQTRQQYKNSFVNTTENDLGLDATNSTELYDYEWDQQEDSTANFTQLNVHWASRIVEVNFGYYGTLFGDQEFDTDVNTQQTGVDFLGAPLNVTGTSDTTTERDLQYLNLDVSLYVTHFLNLVFEGSTLEWDQSSTGSLDLAGTGATPVDTRWDYKINTLTGYAEVMPTRRLNVQLGGRVIDRQLERSGFDAIGGDRDGSFDSDPDKTLVAGVNWRSKYFRISGDYEDGSVNRPFTQVSPYDTERFRVRAAVTPQPGMQVQATFLDYENTNNYYSLASMAEGKVAAVSFSNTTTKWHYFIRYSIQDVDTSAMVNFDTAAFGGSQDGLSTFSTDNEQLRLMVRYTGSRWSAFLRAWTAESDGFNDLTGNVTGPVPDADITIDQKFYDAEIGLSYTLSSGIWLGASYREFDYDDPGQLMRADYDPSKSLNYDGTIVTLRAGYVFGRPKS